jgi:outer membrane receptor protein involved in Fe transport
MKLKFLFIGLLLSMISFAQNSAKVSGIITDKDSKQPVSFVSISLKGLMTNAESDLNGNYEITMKQGTYTIVYSFIGYKTFEKQVTVADNETLNLNISLQENSNSIEGIVITGSTKKTSETALIKEQQKAVEMKQSIGSQEMERKGISNVEEGLTKVTGITKAESRGLFVRGLENRYNNLLINDLQAPSNSPFKKIIPLDLFPTDIVGVLGVYKTFNVNMPGDFAGATINVETAEPQSSQTKLSVGFGYITNTNGSDFLISESANNDQGFFGIQKKNRTIPSEYGNVGNVTLTSSEYKNAYKNSTWNVDKVSAPINNNISFSHSDKFKFNKGRSFSYLLSLNWDNKYQFKEGIERTFGEGSNEYNNNFITSSYSYSTSTSALLGLKYKSDRFQVAANSIYLRTTENLIEDQFGVLLNQKSTPNRLIRLNQFEQSDYFNNQMYTSYKLTSDNKHSIKGGISYVKTIYELPDRKFLVGILENDIFTNSYGGNTLNRQHFKIKGNYYMSGFGEYNFNFGKEIDGKTNKLSLGYNSFRNNLSATYRLFATTSTNGGLQTNTNINDINDQILVDVENGLIKEREESTVEYKQKLDQFVNAGYANLLFNINEKFEINGGVRFETSNRVLKYRELNNQLTTEFNDPYIKDEVKKNYFLPAINTKYKLNDKSNLRFAASQTITRPVLMELLPVQLVNPDGNVTLGNKDLLDTQNLNADLKYEFFSDKKDMFAVGVYAKNIKDPIERIFVASASLLTTYQNSKVANLYGAEFEFIFNMANLSQNLENFSVGFNTSLMKTKVEVSDKNELEKDKSTRELQGASNWVINADAKYEFKFSKDIKNTVSFVYGVKGKNIYSVGTAGLDHIYELPFHKLDFVYSSKLTKNISAKFSADNILNPYQRFELGPNNKDVIEETSLITREYKKGVALSLSLSYTF